MALEKKCQIKSNDARSLVGLAIKNLKLSVRKLTSEFNKIRCLSFSHEAVRKEMKRRGFTQKVAQKIPMLKQSHKAYCVQWAKENKKTDWEKVVFSDEMSIWLAGGRICLWCKGDSKAVKPSTKHSTKLHFGERFRSEHFLLRFSQKILPDSSIVTFYMNV